MRVADKKEEWIGYWLNLLGVRVYRGYCQLVARVGDEWVAIGSSRNLPLTVPTDPRDGGSDPLLLTAFQYDHEQPGSDLLDVLSQRKTFDAALDEAPDFADDQAKKRSTGR